MPVHPWGLPEAVLERPLPPTHSLAPVPQGLQRSWSDPGQLLSQFLIVLGAELTSTILLLRHLENIPQEAQVSGAVSARPRPSYFISVLSAGTWLLGGHYCEWGRPRSHLIQFLYGVDRETEAQTRAESLG